MPNMPRCLLGYIPAHNKFYVVDKDVDVYAYGLSLAIVEYRTAVLRGVMNAARAPGAAQNQVRAILWRGKVKHFLQS